MQLRERDLKHIVGAVRPVTGKDCYISDEVKAEAGINICPKVRCYDDYLMNQCAGMFEKFTDDEHLNSGDELLRGDLLLAINEEFTSGHIAVWI